MNFVSNNFEVHKTKLNKNIFGTIPINTILKP